MTEARQTYHLRDFALSVRDLRAWLERAKHGDSCIYHVGVVQEDKLESVDLMARMHLVRLLVDCSLAMPTQRKVRSMIRPGKPDPETVYAYHLVRMGDDPVPSALTDGEASSYAFEGLLWASRRDPVTSISRAIRRGMSISEKRTAEIVREMTDIGWIIRERGSAAKLTNRAKRALGGLT